MDLQKIGVKLYLDGGGHGPLEHFAPVFHRWIRNHTLDGSLIDVVDYRHVHRGPGVMLIAFEYQLSIGDEDGEPGLAVDWKQPLDGEPLERLSRVLGVALAACAALEREELPDGPVRFAGDRLTLRVSDRALTPNDDGSFAQLRTVLDPLLARLFPDAALEVGAEPDRRRRLAAHVRAASATNIATLAERLALQT